MTDTTRNLRRSAATTGALWAATALLTAATAWAAFAAPAAQAQTGSTSPAASADAYGLYVNATLTPLSLPVNVGPQARATQDFPPGADNPAQAQIISTGEVPAGGALVQNIGILQSVADADGTPLASAVSQAVDVRLLAQAGVPTITADVIRAASTTGCEEDPSSVGTEFLNLRVAGQVDPVPTPEPNTELAPQLFNPLGLRVILNEQHPTADGRGLVVNAIHIYSVAPAAVPGLFTGDIVIAHAMSTVNCPNGEGSTGEDNPVYLTKDADKTTVAPGESFTYTAAVTNTHDTLTCPVNLFIEHMAPAFEFVSTAGDLGETATTADRPGGGTDVILEPAGVVIEPGASISQTFTVKAKDDAAEGVYFNNIEIFCGNLGNWVKGLDAPVEVRQTEPPTTTTPTTAPPPNEPEEHPETGGPHPVTPALALAALALAAIAGRRRATA